MEHKPDAQLQGVEITESGILVPLTAQQLHVKVQEHEKKKQLLNTIVAKVPGNDFDAFKKEGQISKAQQEIRNDEVDILAGTPNVAAELARTHQAYVETAGDKVGDWRIVVNTPDLVTLARNSAVIEKATLTTDKRPEGDIKKRTSLEETDAIIERQKTRFAEKAKNGIQSNVQNTLGNSVQSTSPQPITTEPTVPEGEVTVNNFTEEEQAAKKKEWLLKNQGIDLNAPLDIDLSKSDIGEPMKSVDIDLSKSDIGEPMKSVDIDLSKSDIGVAMEKPSDVLDQKEKEALEEMFVKNTNESMEKADTMSAALEKRKQGAMSRLLEMGATALPKSLEAWEKVDPRLKLALGVTLAGASVYSGGLTAVVGAGVMKTMSAATFGSHFYEKEVQEKIAKGEEVKKGRIAAKSMLYGVIAALGTSALISGIVDTVPGLIDSAVDKATTLKGAVVEWFANLKGSAIAGAVDQGMGDSVIAAAPISVEDSLSYGESIVTPDVGALQDYTIQSGDNLTNIIREQVLPHVPGAESLTSHQQENMVQNLLKQASENKGNHLYDTINQFANPNLIYPGQVLDLNQVKEGIAPFLDHAKTISENIATPIASVAQGGEIFSSVVASPATQSPELSSLPYFDTQVEVPVIEDQSAPLGQPDVGPAPQVSSGSEAVNQEPSLAQPVETPLERPSTVPTVPADVLLDGSGNPILDSSGNFIKTGGGVGDQV